MLDYKGASFSTFDVDQSKVIEYENGKKQSVDCSEQNGGAWWYGKHFTSCKANTNFNAFNFDNLMYEGSQAYATQVSIYRYYEKHYTHRTFHFQI